MTQIKSSEFKSETWRTKKIWIRNQEALPQLYNLAVKLSNTQCSASSLERCLSKLWKIFGFPFLLRISYFHLSISSSSALVKLYVRKERWRWLMIQLSYEIFKRQTSKREKGVLAYRFVTLVVKSKNDLRTKSRHKNHTLRWFSLPESRSITK
jgi:hypothetical protein